MLLYFFYILSDEKVVSQASKPLHQIWGHVALHRILHKASPGHAYPRQNGALEILGLDAESETLGLRQIQQAFRSLARQRHPDGGGNAEATVSTGHISMFSVLSAGQA